MLHLHGIIFLVASLWPLAAAKAPRHILAFRSRGTSSELVSVELKRFHIRRLQESVHAPSGLSCSRRWALLAEGREALVLDLRRPSRPAKALAQLPAGLLKSQEDGLSHFLLVRGDLAILPTDNGYLVADLATGRHWTIRPTCADARHPRRSKTLPAAGDSRSTIRYVHPPSLLPDGRHMLYLALLSKGRDEASRDQRLIAGIADSVSGRAVACHEIERAWAGSVQGLDVHWDESGTRLALSVTSGHRTLHLVGRFEGGRLRLWRPRRLRIGRFHGWRHRWLLATASGRHHGHIETGLWRFHPSGRRVHIRSLHAPFQVITYEPSLRTFLLRGPGRRPCRESRLFALVDEGRLKRLPKWAAMTRLLARDPSGRWALVGTAGSCPRAKAAHFRYFVLRLDGRRIARQLPRRLGWLDRVAPGQVCLTP